MENSFWQFSISNILNLAIILSGAIYFIAIVRNRVDTLFVRMDHIEEKLGRLVDILVAQGKQEERINLINERSLMQGKRIDEADRRLNLIMERNNRNG